MGLGGAAPKLYKNPMDGSVLRGLPMQSPSIWVGKDIPDRKWLVEDLIPSNAVTMLAGDGGLGKSLLSLQLMACCASGKPWLGRRTAHVKAMGIFCEDDMDEIHIRMSKVTDHYGVGYDDIGTDMRVLSRVGFDNTLMESRQVFEHGERREFLEESQFYHQIFNTAVDWGAQLVVLDSLHDLFAGNENDRRHARYFIGMLRLLATEIGGSVVLAAHPSLSGLNTGSGMAGSTAWNNAVRSRLYLTKSASEDEGDEGQVDRRVLKTMKANYSKSGGKIELKWTDGVFVVEGESGGGVLDAIQARNDEKAFIDALETLRQQVRASSDSPQASSYLPRVLRSLPVMKRFSKQKLQQMMMDMLGRGIISRQKIGLGADRHPVLGFAKVVQGEMNLEEK